MPIAESPAFLAKKPTVPPTFAGVDYNDNKALKAAQDSILREQWIQSMMVRLVREELGKCYYREGNNHLDKCSALRGSCTHGRRATTREGDIANAAQRSTWTFSRCRRSGAISSRSRTTRQGSSRRQAVKRDGGWDSTYAMDRWEGGGRGEGRVDQLLEMELQSEHWQSSSASRP